MFKKLASPKELKCAMSLLKESFPISAYVSYFTHLLHKFCKIGCHFFKGFYASADSCNSYVTLTRQNKSSVFQAYFQNISVVKLHYFFSFFRVFLNVFFNFCDILNTKYCNCY